MHRPAAFSIDLRASQQEQAQGCGSQGVERAIAAVSDEICIRLSIRGLCARAGANAARQEPTCHGVVSSGSSAWAMR